MFFIFLFFIIIPIIEIYFFILIGGEIGTTATIALIILTAIIGVSLLKRQGLSVIANFKNKLNQGQVPTCEIADGIFLIISAAFLLTPGFFTDSVGFLLLIPIVRELIVDIGAGSLFAFFYSSSKSQKKSSDTVIDGEFYEEPKDKIRQDKI
jgi:UPF0716 protein FxsA